MLPSSGASSASPLTIHVVRQGATTCLSMRGQVDASNRDRFDHALRAVGPAATRVELELSELESCDVDAAFGLAAFAGEVRDRGGQVAVVGASPWILMMLTLADAGSALAMPPPALSAPQARSTAGTNPEQALALRWLLGVLDHDGVGPKVDREAGRAAAEAPQRVSAG